MDSVELLHVTPPEPIRHAVEALKSHIADEQRRDVQVLRLTRLRMFDLVVDAEEVLPRRAPDLSSAT